MNLKHNLIVLLVLFGQILTAQTHNHSEGDHDHHKHEIGIANSIVYFVNEKEFSYGIHTHYIRNFEDSKYGLGLGYERIFDEHKHNTIGIVGSYRPIEELVLNLTPGVTFEDGKNADINFALHIEATYEFTINNFHIGPGLEIAYDPEDYHISLGFHIGYGF